MRRRLHPALPKSRSAHRQRGREEGSRLADFVMSASNLLLHAFIHDDISPTGDEQRLIGLINRMRLFARPIVVNGAEAVLRAIVEIALKPSIELRQLAKEALSKTPEPDPLLAFSEICRADLDHVRRTGV
jgi:hypothetical protein